MPPRQTYDYSHTALGKTGFALIATRWVIERSNAWMERCKSLVKNFEITLSSS
ncbi:hypothetical protein ACWATR_31860 [Nostoc sp. UIC 10890]